MAECELCSGLGFIYQGLDPSECPMCLGTGEVDEEDDVLDDEGKEDI